MIIKTIQLNNFKFHKELKFDIENINCLIYGENGVGKSSIYWGLYSFFYRDLIDIDKYKTHNSKLAPEVKIEFDTSITDRDLMYKNRSSIYFAHQDFLEKITIRKNFYEVIENSLKNYFPTLNSYIEEFNRINSDIDETNDEEEVKKRRVNINNFSILLDKLKQKANDIIQIDFDEDFTISFNVDWGISQLATKGIYSFSKPKINIKIDNKDNLKLNFNEAKLKLTSIAIFFAFIKLEENQENSLKLLVLDDFLTSLDMANRKLIIQYILTNFKEYQIIIMTHNIQFYNMIMRLLKSRDENSNWDIKNIFLLDKSSADIITKGDTYLDSAEKFLKEYQLEVSGNFLRKEFEYIVNRFEQILEIGRVEEMSNVLNSIKKIDYIMPYPKDNLLKLLKTITKHCENSKIDNNKKVEIIEKQIKDFDKNRYKDYRLDFLKNLIKKTEFYKDILMNSASHDDRDRELYKKEFTNSIKLLKELNKILDSLK